MIKKKYHKLRFFIFILIIIFLYFFISESPLAKHYFSNPELLKSLILGFGILAPLAIVLLQAFQTTISIIPSQLTTIVAGFVFGPFLGLFYSLIGAFFGSMLIFSVARKYGKGLALKLFEKKDLVHFNHLFRKNSLWALFLARMAPLFPNDLVSFGAGLTDIKLRKFNLISTGGFVIQMVILAYFGSELSTGKLSLPLILISIVVSLIFLIALFEKQIKKLLIKDFHKLENDLEREFKRI